MRLVPCRAQVSPRCCEGDADDDGTFDPKTDTVVCTPCYHKLMPYSPSGRLLLSEIPAAIRRLKRGAPPIVFLCMADHVFEGEETMATDAQREVLDAAKRV